VLAPAPGEPEQGMPIRRGSWRPRPTEAVLAAALTAALACLAVVLLSSPAGHSRAAASHGPTHAPTHAATHAAVASKAHKPPAVRPNKPAEPSVTSKPTVIIKPASTLPPTAAAAAAFVGDLQAGVADGRVAQQAGQDLFNHLQPLLFGPPGQNARQIQQQYQQLVQAYDQHQSQGQITGPAAAQLRHALRALGAALGAL
jgi:hypothetical protein